MAHQELLETFDDDTLGLLNSTRKVLVRGDTNLHEVMQDYAVRVRARLVVFGSSCLAAVRGCLFDQAGHLFASVALFCISEGWKGGRQRDGERGRQSSALT